MGGCLEIKPLAALQEPDEMTLRFGPMGLETGRRLVAEDAARYQQEVISSADLVPAVAASTRGTFERLRSTHAYGVLSYEIFTVVHDLVQLLIEQALRDRFMEFHENVVSFTDAARTVHEVRARTFDEVYDAIHSENRLRRPQSWRLPLLSTGESIYFDGMLDSLLRWARGEGLLRGQRNRRLEPLLKTSRNYVARGSGDHLVMPVDTARDIKDAAEIINQLWGAATPDGRLFPAPIRREVQVVAWSPSGGGVLTGPIGGGLPADQYPGWNCVFVRAVPHDDRLDRFDALFETTMYPSELLCGPGSWSDASAWLSQHNYEPDEVEVLDRLFTIQHDQDRLCWPRGLDVTAGLAGGSRPGTWQLIRADYPDDAFAHARAVILGQCNPGAGPCKQCAAEGVGTGAWQEVIDLAGRTGMSIAARQPPDFNVPTLRRATLLRHPDMLRPGNAPAEPPYASVDAWQGVALCEPAAAVMIPSALWSAGSLKYGLAVCNVRMPSWPGQPG